MDIREKIIILDFGSQYTQLIARRTRELGVYSEIYSYSVSPEEIRKISPKGLILSGGPSSVYAHAAPVCHDGIFHLGIPLLGICYGMQLIAKAFGGRVDRAPGREFGDAILTVTGKSELLQDLKPEFHVWMSHGDKVEALPDGFSVVAKTENAGIAAVENNEKKIYGLQFHPEVVHTSQGKEILQNFARRISGCRDAWTMRSFADETIDAVRDRVGQRKVLCAVSGGVDSTVTAALLSRAVGDRLYPIFVDTGLMRHGEVDYLREQFNQKLKLKVHMVDASGRFFARLQGIRDPEKKRKAIGEEFIRVFEDYADRVKDVDFLAQGTLYPDLIESTLVKGPSAVIKSHHNVGGLPEKMHLKLVEPLKMLFKDEVRRVGAELGIDPEFLARHPFPGPGLAVRIIGTVTPERAELLKQADHIFIEGIQKAGLYDEIWQAFAVLLPVKSVGIMGDERTYENACVLRAVTSLDGMTADWAKIPADVLGRISNKIVNEVRGINRVLYDISSKPPGTIEWE